MVDESIWQICVYGLCVGVVIAVMLGLPPLLGERYWRKAERRFESATGIPYECGIRPTGNAQVRPPVQYYLIAMFFVIFDVEAAYLYAWAVAVPETGWLGFIEVTIFVAVLLVSLAYLWLTGALDWHAHSQRPRVRYRQKPHINKSTELYNDRVA
ncbi:MAG: NADH-quinone oxidoreductase subunit A [Nitrospira sp.]|nr:NADH-quinone oxidoreductase subunit A [Nitrospira sp.]MBS0156856.1 NADH-quinone oxidoreductase subunit A [Nitrospira sp.]MBS0166835.1 NADH-quinone oxidoreductase subunit A [Nitrospira sp.]MBX3325235.1 NADH-quinone oxidoreductase subunit A [Nitrospira sp.]